MSPDKHVVSGTYTDDDAPLRFVLALLAIVTLVAVATLALDVTDTSPTVGPPEHPGVSVTHVVSISPQEALT